MAKTVEELIAGLEYLALSLEADARWNWPNTPLAELDDECSCMAREEPKVHTVRNRIALYRETAELLKGHEWPQAERRMQQDLVVVATTDKDQDGNAIEREIPRAEWEDAPIIDARDVSDAQDAEAVADEWMNRNDSD